MKIRASTHLRWRAHATRELWVSGRWEIQWHDIEPWINLGIMQSPELEWQMVVSLCALGARRAGLDFYFVDTAPPLPNEELVEMGHQ